MQIIFSCFDVGCTNPVLGLVPKLGHWPNKEKTLGSTFYGIIVNIIIDN